jgi:N-methylhydantoinase A
MDTSIRMGADIGGTFTDVTLIDEEGKVHRGKTLTTHDDPSKGVVTGVQQVLKLAEKDISEVETIIHGTTLVINALIERRGAKTALICTEGFRDTLDIGYEDRYDMYDVQLEKPVPLVPRALRFGVPERVYSDGSVAMQLDEGEIRKLIPQLRELDVEAVAVSLLHSYKNPEHERLIGKILAEEAPEIYLTLSSDLVPEIREYPRTSTTIANAYSAPVVEQYLRALQSSLETMGFKGKFLMMLSSGGTCTVETAINYPVFIIESGPAAGALAAIYYGEDLNANNILSFDMGGTTAKSCLIDHGQPMTTTNYEVDRGARFTKGSGLPVKVPVIEMLEIGAGGGSIAHIDNLGLLKVGPESAESDPGPVSYRLGGTRPTVTDADLVLGYLDPDFFLGGKMQLDKDAALAAITENIAKPLGIKPMEAAWGIHNIVNENMANAARVHAIEKGKDPRSYLLFASGGAGPVHACHVAKKLELKDVFIPKGAGVASAFGMLTAPIAFNFVRSYFTSLDNIDWDRANEVIQSMKDEGAQLMLASGVDPKQTNMETRCEMRYQGQTHEIYVKLPDGVLSASRKEEIIEAFTSAYNELYSEVKMDARPIEILNWRMNVAGQAPEIQNEPTESGNLEVIIKGEREAYFQDGGFRPTPVYDRYSLPAEVQLSGPAIVEEHESTVIVPPDGTIETDRFGNMRVKF